MPLVATVQLPVGVQDPGPIFMAVFPLMIAAYTDVVADWIDSEKAHDVELLWHASEGAKFSARGQGVFQLESQGKCISLTIDGGLCEVNVVEGRESPPQGWVSKRFYERSAAPVLSMRARLLPRQVLQTKIQREAPESAHVRDSA